MGLATVPGEGGDWVLGIEFNGFLGVAEELIVPASVGTQIVSHFRNIEAVRRFYWIEDQDIRLSFEPLFASHREGSAPDALIDVMRQVGFDLNEEGENEQYTEAAFELAAGARAASSHRISARLRTSPRQQPGSSRAR